MMMELIGDILNWTVAGVMFPLMLLPIAALRKGAKTTSLALWLSVVFAVTMAAVIFAWAIPVLSITPSLLQIIIFTLIVLLLAAGIFAIGGVQATIDLITPGAESFVRTTGKTVMWLLLAMAFIQFMVVVLRYVFGINYIFMQETITYMHGAVFLLAGGYALLTNDHVRVDIFYSTASDKQKALIDLVGTYFLLLPVCLLLIWAASPYVGQSWSILERSTETSGIRPFYFLHSLTPEFCTRAEICDIGAVYILKSFIPAFAVLLMMAGFSIAARASTKLQEHG